MYILFETLLNCKGCEGISCPLLVVEGNLSGKTDIYDQKQQKVAFFHGNCVHHANCQGLIAKGVAFCDFCKDASFRSNMRGREAYLRNKPEKIQDQKTSANSKVAVSTLSNVETKERCKNLSEKVKSLQRRVRDLEVRVKTLLEKESVPVTDEQHQLLASIVENKASEINNMWAEDSCQRILWEQQAKRSQLKDARGMRWHPTIIRWCISLFAKSPAAYRQLSGSGFLSLPHPKTLQSYINFTKPSSGLNKDVIELLAGELKISDMEEWQRNVCLVWDEMRIKSGLAWSQSTGKLVGFCEMDTFNEELQKLSSSLANESESA